MFRRKKLMKLLLECAVVDERGVALQHHSIARASLTSDLMTLQIVVESWPSEASRLSGAAAAAAFQVSAPVAGLDLSDLHAGLVAAVAGDAQFSGAVQVADAAEPLQLARSRQLAALLAARQVRDWGPIEVGDNTFDGDPMAQTRTVGAAVCAVAARQAWLVSSVQSLAAAAGLNLPQAPAFSLQWTLADNGEVELDEAQLLEVLFALKDRAEGLHATWRSVRADVLAAETVDGVQSIAWPT